MKVLGLSFGRKMKNCEIIVKEALMEAEKAGHEVSFVRMLDMEIKTCTGCGACMSNLVRGGNGKCIIKDDLPFVDELMLEADALIVAAPVYALGPSGQLKQMIDRMGPSHDLAFLTKENEKRIAEGKTGDQLLDPRHFKHRFAGLISVGGAVTQNWVSFGLVTMHILCFPSQIKVIDQIDAYGMGKRVNPVLDDAFMEQVRRLGRNIAFAAGKTHEEIGWMGSEEGTCPVCHNNMLTVNGTRTVECPVCGIYGTLELAGDTLKVTFSPEEQARSRHTLAGKIEHWAEINSFIETHIETMRKVGEEKLNQQLKKYIGYKEVTKA